MKTTLERAPGKQRYGRKDLVMRLVRADDRSELGQATIDLAHYYKVLERKLFSVDLAKSQFPEALIDFYITATPVVGKGRSATVRAVGGMAASNKKQGSQEIAVDSQVI